MEVQTRHRIIGIAVIVALILIFVPMLVSKRLEQSKMIAPGIPTPPAVPQVVETAVPPPAQDQVISAPSDASSGDAQSTAAPVEKVCSPDSEDCSMDATEDTDADLPALPEDDDSTPVETPPAVQTPELAPTQNLPAVQPATSPKLQPDNTPAKISNVAMGKTVSAPVVTHRQAMVKAQSNSAAWIVQVGLFANSKNADGLIHRLHQKGFTAFGYLVESPKGTATHVYVGPSTDYAKAKTMQSRLQKEMNIKGYVTQFNASSFHQ